MTAQVKYPDVTVALIGADGNAMSIMGSVTGALRRAKVPAAEIDNFFGEATSGDYDHLLTTVMQWVNVE